ncbi:MAG: MerR family transcriptional regulator [Paracoccaceae bacterium]
MIKSPDAFRTISEVADFLETPAHVLRFWESRFPQIRPVKRAGGRRYYRPADVALLTGIKRLLHEEGMTIRGVQKILREQGVRHVSGLPDDATDTEDDDALAAALAEATGPAEPERALPPAEVETAQIIALQAALRSSPVAEPTTEVLDAPENEGDQPTDWQSDSASDEDDVTDLPHDHRPAVMPPPPPATETPTIPVISDLFARAPDRDSPPVSPPPPAAPVEEAPMAVWADEPGAATDGAEPVDPDPPAPPSPILKITRIGAAAAPVTPPSVAEPLLAGPTLAQRLRALSVADLTVDDRAHLAQLRDQAVALRARLAGPARANG